MIIYIEYGHFNYTEACAMRICEFQNVPDAKNNILSFIK